MGQSQELQSNSVITEANVNMVFLGSFDGNRIISLYCETSESAFLGAQMSTLGILGVIKSYS